MLTSTPKMLDFWAGSKSQVTQNNREAFGCTVNWLM